MGWFRTEKSEVTGKNKTIIYQEQNAFVTAEVNISFLYCVELRTTLLKISIFNNYAVCKEHIKRYLIILD